MDSIKAFDFEVEQYDGETDVIGGFTLRGHRYDIRYLQDAGVLNSVHKIRTGTPDVSISALFKFMESALTIESAKRFDEVALHPQTGLKTPQLMEIFGHVLSVVSAFPTGPQAASSTASRPTGTGSRAATRGRPARAH